MFAYCYKGYCFSCTERPAGVVSPNSWTTSVRRDAEENWKQDTACLRYKHHSLFNAVGLAGSDHVHYLMWSFGRLKKRTGMAFDLVDKGRWS